MDIKVLKKECNDLIDELESLQRTDANLDQQIRELQNRLEKKTNPQSEIGLPQLNFIMDMKEEEAECIIPETAVEEEKKIPEEKKEEESPWKEMDQQRFPADTVIIYESSNLENTIVRVIKIVALCGILGGIMVSMITLIIGMQ